jgi:hypothetical protein
MDAHANFAYSTIATAPSPATSGTSLVVAATDGAKFPAVPFNATIWPVNAQPSTTNAEIVRVTGRSTDTLTFTRAQESSSARTIVVGDQIAATITAKTLTDVESAIPSVPVSSVFTRTGAVVAADGDYEGVVASALTGATAAVRFVGGTTSGSPGSGTFVVGDFVVARNGHIFVCTVAGSPGTWVDVGSVSNLVTSVFTRTGAVAAATGDYTAAQVTNAADKSSGSQQAFTGEVSAPDLTAAGLTGATSASRYVGATASGAPVSGAFVIGDFIVARNGHVFVCTTAGSPGTWTDVGSVSNLVTSVFGRTGAVAATSGDYNLNQIGNATADYSINSHKLTNLTDPGSAQDAATKAYVDAAITSASTDVHVYAAGAGQTWSKPTGAKAVEVICIGAGGGGGGGFSGAAAANVSGGAGGGGGAVSRAVFQPSDVPTSVTVGVGAGGAGGAAGVNGSDGSAPTTFGSLLLAGSASGGNHGASAANTAGAPGGSTAGSSTGGSAAAFPSGGSGGVSGQGAISNGTNASGLNAEWGGASGGGSQAANAAGKTGGSSIFGGPGGGAGGGASTTTGGGGGAGGATQSYAAGGGGGAGTGGATGGPGGDGTFTGPFCGAAGGGGGGKNAIGTAGKGGNGLTGSGGGGGGAAANGTGGAGGNGGDGRCIVITHL